MVKIDEKKSNDKYLGTNGIHTNTFLGRVQQYY
jgi:hypothetical protein